MTRIPVLGLICAVAIAFAGTSGSSEAGPACANSYAQFNWLTGSWEGSWTNLDFLNTGDVDLESSLDPNCTGQATIDGVFLQPPGQVVEFTYHDDNGGVVLNVVDDPNFGTATINVGPDGSLDYEAVAPPAAGWESVEGTGSISPSHIELEYTLMLFGGDTTDETMGLMHPPALIQGDIDCSGTAVSRDALKLLLSLIPVAFSQGFGCPALSEDIPPLWGDVNCDGLINEADILALLRHAGFLAVQQTQPCTPIGEVLPD